MPRTRSASIGLLLAIFFVSGATALVYEVLWVRLLGLLFGNTLHAISAVLAIFLGGLAAGAFLGGRWIDRRPGTNPLVVYGVLEAAIGLVCLAVPALLDAAHPLYAWIYRTVGDQTGPLTATRVAMSAVILSVPTALMGATLPVLSRYLVTAGRGTGGPVGRLYGANTLGAGLGALLAGFVLIPILGVQATNTLAAGANLALAAAVLLGWRAIRRGVLRPVFPRPEEGAGPQTGTPAPVPLPRFGLPAVYAAYAMTGFAGLLSEVAWTRGLTLLIGSSTFAFTLMLSTFIACLGAGAFVSSRWADRRRDPLGMLALLAFGVALSALAVLPLFGTLPRWVPAAVVRLGGHFGFFAGFQFCTIALIMAVPTLLLGALFPLVTRVALRDPETAGRTVGRLYAANTVGTILGSLATGFVLIPAIGIQRTVIVGALVVALAGVLFNLLRGDRPVPRRLGLGAAGWLFAAGVAAALPAWDRDVITIGPFTSQMVARLRAAPQTHPSLEATARSFDLLFYREGSDVTVTVRRDPLRGDVRMLQINGKIDASTGNDMRMQVLLGQLPMLLHPAPQEVALVGLATGTSLGAVETHPGAARIDCVEISAAVHEATRYFDAFNHRALDDPRARVTIQDGRNFLSLTDRRYDVIISQPSSFWIPGVAYLATREYFASARARLRPGGIMAMWLAAYELTLDDFRSVVATFRSVFPEATLWRGLWGRDFVLIGTAGEAALAWERIVAGWKTPAVKADLARVGLRTPMDLVGQFVMGPAGLDALSRDAPLHTDDRPFVEFHSARAAYGGSATRLRSTRARQVESPRALLRSGRPGDGGWESLLKALPALADANRDLLAAAQAREEGNGDAAIRLLEEARARLPGRAVVDTELAGLYLTLGLQALARGRAGIAAQSLHRVIALDPSNAMAPLSLAGIRLSAGKAREGAALLEAALARGATTHRTRLALGLIYQKEGRHDEAERVFQEALDADPDDAEAHWLMGQHLLARGAVFSAMAHLRETLRLAPGQSDAPRIRKILQALEARARRAPGRGAGDAPARP